MFLVQEAPVQSQRGQRPRLEHPGVGAGPGFGTEAPEASFRDAASGRSLPWKPFRWWRAAVPRAVVPRAPLPRRGSQAGLCWKEQALGRVLWPHTGTAALSPTGKGRRACSSVSSVPQPQTQVVVTQALSSKLCARERPGQGFPVGGKAGGGYRMGWHGVLRGELKKWQAGSTLRTCMRSGFRDPGSSQGEWPSVK